MKNKIFSKKTLLAAIAPAIAILLIASLITATALLNNQGKIKVEGVIGRGENGEAIGVISDAPFQYEASTRSAFIFDFEKFLSVVFNKDFINTTNSLGISISQQSGTIIIDAFRRARVSGDKLIALGKYLAKSAKSFSEGFTDPDQASAILLLYAILQTDTNGDTFFGILNQIDTYSLYKEVIKETGLNPEEAGRVLYQLAVALSEGTDKQLIADLGERSFVVLFSGTMVAMEEISMLTSGSSLASARMVGELLYELGYEYRKIIDTFGIENLNNLFGSVYLSDMLMEADHSEYVLMAFAESKELFGFGVAFLSEMLTVLDSSIAYSYHDYLHSEGEDSGKAYAQSVLHLGAAIGQGLEYAYEASGLDDITLASKISKINAYLHLVSEPDVNYEQALGDELLRLLNVFVALTNLAEWEAEAREADSFEDYLEDSSKVNEIISCAQTVLNYAPNIERGAKIATTLILFSYLSYLVASTV